MKFSTLLYEVDADGTLLLTVNRPDKLNALNATVIDELDAVFRSLPSESSVKGVVITGSGSKAFVAGADIKQFQNLSSSEAEKFARRGQEVFDMIENLSKPVVAAVNGFALGGGCELALSCHMRIASQSASFGQPEVNLGIIPGYGGTQRLPRLIGRGRATELILTGERISAQRAYEIGLVNKLVPDESLIEQARHLVTRASAKAPVAIGLALQAMNAADGSLDKGLKYEARLFGKALETEDAKEGVSAFLEKRQPVFKGR
ncbi:MAG: enoyl-CoA hydratase [Rhodothermales bacterium]|nr:enoyl-CoA hydratase [Rhodothermales bacterium]